MLLNLSELLSSFHLINQLTTVSMVLYMVRRKVVLEQLQTDLFPEYYRSTSPRGGGCDNI